MNEPNRARTARKLGGNVVVPLLLKGTASGLRTGPVSFTGRVSIPKASRGSARFQTSQRNRSRPTAVVVAACRCATTRTQEQVRRLRERGSHASAPVTPPRRRGRQRRAAVTRRPALWSRSIPLRGPPLERPRPRRPAGCRCPWAAHRV